MASIPKTDMFLACNLSYYLFFLRKKLNLYNYVIIKKTDSR